MLDIPPQRLSTDSPMLDQMQESDDGVYRSISPLDGRERIYGYSRIGATPLFIGYGLPKAEVLAHWRSEMLQMGLVALMASVLLGFTATTIMRRNRHLGATAVSWRRTAEALEQEVDRRLRAEDVAAERKRLLDEVRVLTAQRQSILENMAEGVIALDARGRIIYANHEAVKLLGPFRQGEQAFASLVPSRRILAADGSDLDPALAPDQPPLRGEDLPESEFRVRNEQGRDAACIFRGGTIFGADGEAEGAVLTFWNVSERKREAERRDLLMRELDHRVRNMLATIMAMIRISNEPRQSKEAFVAALSGRVAAMARTQGILAEGKWKGATIGRLVEDEVASAADARQLVLDGDPDLMLPPREAADLALALHELATNATKHGAWSVPEGRVEMHWSQAAGHVLRVQWKETGGPAIDSPPARRGFGSTLLQAVFPGDDGVSIAYEPDGLRCTISVPIHDEQHEATATKGQSRDAAAGTEEATLEGLHVLVVEDEALIRLDLVQILRDAGATIVAEAGSLEDGLKKAEAARVDAAILDRNLKGASSLPLAQLLAKRGARIVFVSGYRPADQTEAPEEADHVHLQKPVTPQALLAALASAVTAGRGRK